MMGEIVVRISVVFLAKMFVEDGLHHAGEAILLKRGLPRNSALKGVKLDADQSELLWIYENEEYEGQIEILPEFQIVRFEWHKF